MHTIYVYRRNRAVQADLILPDGVTLLAHFRVRSQSDVSRIQANPGPYVPERIKALIDRIAAVIPRSKAGISASNHRSIAR